LIPYVLYIASSILLRGTPRRIKTFSGTPSSNNIFDKIGILKNRPLMTGIKGRNERSKKRMSGSRKILQMSIIRTKTAETANPLPRERSVRNL
jgi:hypothetical protein